MGVVFGVLARALGHALTGGRRDFNSARITVAQLAERVNATRHVTAAAVHAVAQARLDPARNVVVLAGALDGLRGYQISRHAAGFMVTRAP